MLLFLIFFPLAAAALCALAGRRSPFCRDIFPCAACFVTLLCALAAARAVFSGAPLTAALPDLCGLGLSFTMNGFRAVWSVLILFCWSMSELFAREYLTEHRVRYHAFTLLTLAGTLGVFLSADLYTTFVFFELMSLSSWVWVVHEDTPAAHRAGDTYLAVAVAGGLVTLFGLFVLDHLTGDLTIAGLYERCLPLMQTEPALLGTAGVALLLGFGAKAGMFPLHFWLPMAHPVAPAPASALLSGMLTKCGLFGILVVSCEIFRGQLRWGELVLALGTVTMVWGAVLGLFSVDLKRTLACSSVSQIGFILTGIGMSDLLGAENALAAQGVMLHMMNHSLIKLVLFLFAGVLAMNRHTLDLNRLRGACRGNRLMLFAFLMAACSLAGVPLFSGYVSKTLLHESIVEGEALLAALGGHAALLRAIEWAFLITGGLTLAYLSKLFYVLFLLPPTEEAAPLRLRPASALAFTLPALALPLLGLFPHQTMDRLAALGQDFLHGGQPAHPVAYFSLTNLGGAAISITIGLLVFFLFVRRRLFTHDGVPAVRDVWPVWFDLEARLLRPLCCTGLPTLFGTVFRLLDYLPDGFILLLRRTLLRDCLPTPPAVSSSEALDRTGHALDRLSGRLGRRTGKPSFVYVLAEKKQAFELTTRLIFASLSFGLLLFCTGLTLTLLYLLL